MLPGDVGTGLLDPPTREEGQQGVQKPVRRTATGFLTGTILIAGKMSIGMETIETIPRTAINSARTTNVYGRRSASLTIHIFVRF